MNINGRMSRRNKGSLPANFDAELRGFAGLSITELRQKWRTEVNSAPPPLQSTDVLAAMLAWAIQAGASGGLDAWTERRLGEIADVLNRNGQYEPRGAKRLNVGTILIREWKGVTHRVSVEANGFHHADQCYSSLSDVARTITGTRWSGPRFFGLEIRKPKRQPTSTGVTL